MSEERIRKLCKAESMRPTGNRMAREALRSDGSAREYLLTVMGDPSRTLHDRVDASNLVSMEADARTVVEAEVRCPECMEGEVFRVDPHTGDVSCHCGQPMEVPEYPGGDA